MPAVAAVLASAFAAYRPQYTERAFDATTPSADALRARFGEGPVWIAIDGERPVGTVAAVPRGDGLYVRSMAVSPTARGRKLGARLLDEAVAEARLHGIVRLTLSTTPFLAEAIGLYERHGFHRTGEMLDLYGTPLIAMERRLDADAARVIYHPTPRARWETALAAGVYPPAPSGASVPCADVQSYVDLANRTCAERDDVVLLFIDATRLDPSFVRRAGDGTIEHGAPLPLDAVFEAQDMPVDAQGRFAPHHESAALAVRGADTFADTRARALHAMAGFDRPWWIAGGWAIDLFLGEVTRPHADLEISVLDGDQRALHAHLRDWDVRIAAGGALHPWNGEPLVRPHHQLWARAEPGLGDTVEEFSAHPTMIGVLIEEHRGDVWRFRRDGRVTRPVAELGAMHGGLPSIAPEVALLFKARDLRHKDRRDFERVASRLDASARGWLRSALDVLYPGHPARALLENDEP
jgi:ribosomal protein S18 acetylase RimI-like enzyme/uncharacterized protein (DUF952 family)